MQSVKLGFKKKSFFLEYLLFFFFLFSANACYKPPQASGILDFLNLKTSIDAINTPVKVFVQVSGLSGGTLNIENDLTESLVFTANGTQQFPTLVKYRSAYNVFVGSLSGGTVTQTCHVSNPNGPIILPTTTIFITCGVVFYDLSVKVLGLDPSVASTTPLVLQNMTDQISFTSDGTKTFATQIGDTASYSISFFSVPTGHTCAFIPNTSGSGNISGGPLTVTLDCITPLKYLPASQTLGSSSQIKIQLSYKGIDPGSCSLDLVSSPGKFNSATSSSPPTITYPSSPNDNTIVLVPNGPDFWGPGGESFVQLSGCTGGGLPIQNGSPMLYNFTAITNIRFVDISAGSDLSGCGALGPPSAYCASIEQGITECDALGAPCSVYVAEGTYIPSGQIFLGNVSSLIGGFASGFGSLDPDPVNHPTIIRDNRTSGCGTSFADFCSAVLVSSISLNPSTLSLTVSGFQIQMNLNADYSTGIQVLNSQFNTGQIKIAQNIVFGNEIPSTGDGFRVGLLVNESDNVLVTGNWLRGGSGRRFSFGAFLEASGTAAQPIIFYRNLIDGLAEDPTGGGFSSALGIETGSLDGFIVAENKLNAYQYLNPSITPNISFGMSFSDEIISATIINNDIYVGNSSNPTLGSATGIFLPNVGPTFLKILNNQFIAKASSTNSIGMSLLQADASSVVRGNNFFVNTPIQVTPDPYIFCGSVLARGCVLGVPILPISSLSFGDFSTNYNDDPRFKFTASINQIWNLNVTTGTATVLNSPCTSVYGGIDPTTVSIPSTALPFVTTDFLQNARTANGNSLTPPGASGLSVGALEFDANCF
ncbi:hypothetical protein EHO59_16735 [Leptospira semungkisensis]|uniref:Uncharacterized protein n=2 Tax=Leptospira semungkisensis TaxID=2484985 RepID=A0A4R9FM67_9LEPT|nr:hypothetical protein EHO59_16735 [Leptospira semungkisensis]